GSSQGAGILPARLPSLHSSSQTPVRDLPEVAGDTASDTRARARIGMDANGQPRPIAAIATGAPLLVPAAFAVAVDQRTRMPGDPHVAPVPVPVAAGRTHLRTGGTGRRRPDRALR